MKKFVKQIIVIFTCFSFFYTALYTCLSHFFSRTEGSNALYVYGDSQTVQGLNINELKNRTGLHVYSAAKHGAGIYDFIYFTEKIPENSKVIVSVSEHSQIRPDIFEANTAPLNYNCLRELYISNYSMSGFYNILQRGKKLPRSLYFKSNHLLYPYSDSINLHTPISSFLKRYSTINENNLIQKQAIYLKGIQKLVNKNCDIIFIEYPYEKGLKNISERTKYNKLFNEFRLKLSKKCDYRIIDTVFLKSNKNLMYDYTHLNSIGAKLLTNKLIERMKVYKQYKHSYIKFEN